MINLNKISNAKNSSKLTKLVSNINKTCNSLVEVFEKFMDAVSTYGVWTVQKMSKWIQTLLTDRIMNKIFRLKSYLKELNTNIENGKITNNESNTIIASLIDNKDALVKKMQESNFLYNNFGFLIMEVKTMIDDTLNLMVIRA